MQIGHGINEETESGKIQIGQKCRKMHTLHKDKIHKIQKPKRQSTKFFCHMIVSGLLC